jgi:isopropylmalate/homocitrate/citramalate synthase
VGDELTEPFPYRTELVGQPQPESVLGKGSGIDSIAIWLGKLGIHDAETKEIETILTEVKGVSLGKKALLDEDEFRAIVQEVLPGRVG